MSQKPVLGRKTTPADYDDDGYDAIKDGEDDSPYARYVRATQDLRRYGKDPDDGR